MSLNKLVLFIVFMKIQQRVFLFASEKRFELPTCSFYLFITCSAFHFYSANLNFITMFIHGLGVFALVGFDPKWIMLELQWQCANTETSLFYNKTHEHQSPNISCWSPASTEGQGEKTNMDLFLLASEIISYVLELYYHIYNWSPSKYH